jgi:hypothetical protein
MEKLLLISFLAACVEIMFQEYMTREMILEPYFNILKKLYRSGKFGKWISKPLGLCRFCHGFWIALFIYFLYFKLNTNLLLYLGFNLICIKSITLIIIKYENNNKP